MLNEFIFAVTIVSLLGYLLLCFVLGRRWLYSAIVINLVLIGVFGAKLISLFGAITNVGNIFYVGVFLIGQLLVEHYGKEEAKKSIWLGLVATVFFVFMGQLTIAFVATPQSTEASTILKTLFEFAPRITLASLLAYLFSQTLNIYLYGYLSKKKPRQIWFRSLVALTAGQFLDSVIFFSIAFLGAIPGAVLINAAATGFAVKTLVGIISIPCIYISYRLKTRKDVLEEEYEAILTGIGEGIVVVDRDGMIIAVNRAFEKLVGWTSAEVLGKKMLDILVRENESGKVIPFEKRILNKVLAGQKMATPMTNHTYLRRRNGSRFPVKIAVTPILIDQKIMGAVELFSDVTAEKQLEQTRRDFLALASHQLRTPLSSSRWVIETLLGGVAGEMTKKQKKYVQQLYQVNTQMIKLASDTLGVLRLESGAVPVQKEQFSITKLYQEVIKIFEISAKNNKVVLESTSAPAMSVVTNFSLTLNIIESFVANAIGYSAGGKVTLGSEELPNETRLFVKDEGIGIPKDEQDRIFERFYRASNAKTMKVDGSGLGLSISQMLAEKIGAKITFTSEEGKGSTFFLHIPKK